MAQLRCIVHPFSQSRIEVGEPQVVSATIQISASVGQNGVNRSQDVRSIQNALNRIDREHGGAMPPLKEDGICGPLTRTAIQRFQQRQFGAADGRVDPNRKTLAKLNEFVTGSLANSLAANVFAANEGLGKILIAKAVETIPVARTWISAAQAYLNAAISNASNVSSWVEINKHFHLDKANDPFIKLQHVSGIYRIMQVVLGKDTLFEPFLTPPSVRYAEASLGGLYKKNTRDNKVRICPSFESLWIKSRTAVVVHELAHLVGGTTNLDSIKHFAHELPVPDGTVADGCPRNYADLYPEEAIRNAASYATFAIHAFYGYDNRAGWL